MCLLLPRLSLHLQLIFHFCFSHTIFCYHQFTTHCVLVSCKVFSSMCVSVFVLLFFFRVSFWIAPAINTWYVNQTYNLPNFCVRCLLSMFIVGWRRSNRIPCWKWMGWGVLSFFFCVLYYYCLKWIWLCVHHKSHTLHELNHLILIMIINTFSSLFTRVYSFYYVFFLQSFLPIVQLSDFFTIQSIGFWFMRVCVCVLISVFAIQT